MHGLLKYPTFDMRLKKEGEQTLVLDLIRKKWLVLSPEEFVRQHVLYFLIEVKKYPISRISVEKELSLNDLKKRYDIVIYDRDLKPFLVVECKAPYIELNQEVVQQAQRYNLTLKAPLLMISNGVSDFIFNSENKVTEIPEYL